MPWEDAASDDLEPGALPVQQSPLYPRAMGRGLQIAAHFVEWAAGSFFVVPANRPRSSAGVVCAFGGRKAVCRGAVWRQR